MANELANRCIAIEVIEKTRPCYPICYRTRHKMPALSCRSCLIDGKVVVCGDDGVPVFDRLRYGRQPKTEAVLFAFDLLELGGKDMRRTPLEDRKGQLATLLRRVGPAHQGSRHFCGLITSIP